MIGAYSPIRSQPSCVTTESAADAAEQKRPVATSAASGRRTDSPMLAFPLAQICRQILAPDGVQMSCRHVLAGQSAIGIEIAPAGRFDDFGRQLGRRRVAVPAAGVALDVEPVAQRLLVEAGLRIAGPVAVERPETRAVGRHHLVDQQDLAGGTAAELELGV